MMTLTGVRDYLKERGNASLAEVAMHFDASEEAARGALDLWMKKGKVRPLPAGASCSKAGSCGCSCKAEEIFEWVGDLRLN
jgi:hypothetical protein